MKTLQCAAMIVVSISLFAMCGKKEESNQKQETALKSDSAAVRPVPALEVGAIKLRLGCRKGDRLVYRLITQAEQTRSMGTQTQTTAIRTAYVFTHEVMDVDKEQRITLKVRCDSVRVDANSPMGTVTYDSNDAGDSLKARQQPFTELGALANSEFYSKITPRGDILQVYEVDEIIDKLLGPHRNEVDPKTRQMIRDGFADSMLPNLLRQWMQFLPENPVEIDSSWSKVTNEKMETLDVKSTATYTLKKIEESGGKRTAFIDAKLRATFAGKRSFEQQGVRYEIGNPQVSGSGSSSFDLERGCVLRRDLSISTSMNYKVSGKDKETGKPSSVNLLQRIKQETSVQLLN